MKYVIYAVVIIALMVGGIFTYEVGHKQGMKAGYNQAVRDLPPTAVVYVKCLDGVCAVLTPAEVEKSFGKGIEVVK